MGDVIRPDRWQLDERARDERDWQRRQSVEAFQAREIDRARGWTKDKIPSGIHPPDDEPYPRDDGGTAA